MTLRPSSILPDIPTAHGVGNPDRTRDRRESPKDSALQIRSHMQPVLWLPYNYIGHSMQTWLHHLHRLGCYLQGGHSVCLPMESA